MNNDHPIRKAEAQRADRPSVVTVVRKPEGMGRARLRQAFPSVRREGSVSTRWTKPSLRSRRLGRRAANKAAREARKANR